MRPKRIMAPQASSLLKLYAGKWKVFENWCLSKDLQPLKATIPQFANFLLYLFHERKISLKSIEGYRTTISRPIRPWCRSGPIITQSLEVFFEGRTQGSSALGTLFVLFSLVKEPFEPISKIPLKLLTLKIVLVCRNLTKPIFFPTALLNWATCEEN